MKRKSEKEIERRALENLLKRHKDYRRKINSQCDTLIQKSLVEKMIDELK